MQNCKKYGRAPFKLWRMDFSKKTLKNIQKFHYSKIRNFCSSGDTTEWKHKSWTWRKYLRLIILTKDLEYKEPVVHDEKPWQINSTGQKTWTDVSCFQKRKQWWLINTQKYAHPHYESEKCKLKSKHHFTPTKLATLNVGDDAGMRIHTPPVGVPSPGGYRASSYEAKHERNLRSSTFLPSAPCTRRHVQPCAQHSLVMWPCASHYLPMPLFLHLQNMDCNTNSWASCQDSYIYLKALRTVPGP